MFQRQRISGPAGFITPPTDWIGSDVFFSGAVDEATGLWRISVPAETGTLSRNAERLTFGTSVETKPSVSAAGRIAFASLKQDLNIWSLPIAADGVRTTGEPVQVTNSAVDVQQSLRGRTNACVHFHPFRKQRRVDERSDLWRRASPDGIASDQGASRDHRRRHESRLYDSRRVNTADLRDLRDRNRWRRAGKSCAMAAAVRGTGLRTAASFCIWIPEGAASPGLSLGIVDAGTREKLRLPQAST